MMHWNTATSFWLKIRRWLDQIGEAQGFIVVGIALFTLPKISKLPDVAVAAR